MKVSDCCGAAPVMIGDYDSSTEDYRLCSRCHEHCEYIEETEFESIDGPVKKIPEAPVHFWRRVKK